MSGMMKRHIAIIVLSILPCLSVLAQNRLQPCDRGHYRIWQQVFDRYYNEGAWYQYIAAPSFTPPYALYIRYPRQDRESYVLELKSQERTYKMQCDTTVYLRLAALMEYAVHTAQFPLSGRLGLDGVQYFLFERDKGTTVWTPKVHSATAMLTEVMDSACQAVKQNNPTALRHRSTRVDSLTRYFKSLIPDEEQAETSESSLGGVNMHNQQLNVYLVFPKTTETPEAIEAKYKSLFVAVCRWLFLHTSVIDLNGHINITVKPDEEFAGHAFKQLEWRHYLTVKESDLTEERLIALLQKYLADRVYQ
uniref:Uncharacterized protein n=1 Tax=Prevotella sp. GTC17260 TaxID=3236796 RepID=A0AB33JC77_9BACT